MRHEVREDIRNADLFSNPAQAKIDPYGAAMEIIQATLEWALDDGISGSMNEAEYETLEALAHTLASLDPASAPQVAPR